MFYSTASICKIIKIAFRSLFSKYLSEKIGSRCGQLEDLLTYPCKWSALPGQRGRPNYLNSSRLFTCYTCKCICCSICLSICIEMYKYLCNAPPSIYVNKCRLFFKGSISQNSLRLCCFSARETSEQ